MKRLNSTPVGHVRAWAPLATAVTRLRESSAALRYVGASVSGRRHGAGLPGRGQVLWAADMDESQFGLAWGWTRLVGDVVVMTDPMGVATNLALVDDVSGEPLSESQVMCCLNTVIQSLPWQEALQADPLDDFERRSAAFDARLALRTTGPLAPSRRSVRPHTGF